jgi:hypothetical protein
VIPSQNAGDLEVALCFALSPKDVWKLLKVKGGFERSPDCCHSVSNGALMQGMASSGVFALEHHKYGRRRRGSNSAKVLHIVEVII